MKYVLDTTVVSALMRAEEGPARRLLALRPADVGIPQPVLAEIRYGLARLPRSRRKQELEERLGVVLRGVGRVEWTDEVSRLFGDLKSALERRGERVDDFDVAIAAHALAVGAAIVSQNLRHFARVPGLSVESWD